MNEWDQTDECPFGLQEIDQQRSADDCYDGV
jgi:hypothetical protein